jgi:TPR repeat protein
MTIANQIAVRTDRGFFVFEREGDDRLRGVDHWTAADGTWQRTDTSPSCAPVAASDESRVALSHELCELDGFTLQQSGDVDGALALFERCCEGGAAASCDRAGQIHEILRRAPEAALGRYRLACDGGHPRGCYDLAMLVRRTAGEEDGRAALQHACDVGSTDACVELID